MKSLEKTVLKGNGWWGLLLLMTALLSAFTAGNVFAAQFAYISNNAANTVSVIDTGTNTAVDAITAGSGPHTIRKFIGLGECAQASDNLVSWWKAEGNAIDSAGTNHGTLMNGATFAAGKVGQAFSLDGVDDFVQVTDAPDLNFAPTSPLTIYMWAYPTAGGDMHLIGKRGTCWDSGQSANYQIAQDSTHGLHFNSGGLILSTYQELLTSQWQHVAVTADGSSFRIYINGQEKGAAVGTLGAQNNGAPLIIGGVCPGVAAMFPGLLDEVAIVNRALTQEEIQAIYNAGRLNLPARPTSLTARAISSSTVVLSWKDNSNNEAGFKIQRKEGECTSLNPWIKISAKDANVTAHTNSGLTPEKTYSYRVRAYNADGNSAWSNCVKATTALAGTPNASTNFTATSVSSGRINLVWKDNSNNENNFKIYRKAGTETPTLLHTTAANAISYADSTATGNDATSSYSYYIRACNTSGCSPTTTTAHVPYKPTVLTVAQGESGILNLSWTDTSNNETGFQIQRKSGVCSSASTWSPIETTGASDTTYSDTGLASGTYSYRIRSSIKTTAAPYANGYSGWSNCVSAVAP